MTPETLSRLQELKATASTIQQCELRVSKAKSDLANAELMLANATSAKRTLVETLQGACQDVVRDISLSRPLAETAEIVRWFTNG